MQDCLSGVRYYINNAGKEDTIYSAVLNVTTGCSDTSPFRLIRWLVVETKSLDLPFDAQNGARITRVGLQEGVRGTQSMYRL